MVPLLYPPQIYDVKVTKHCGSFQNVPRVYLVFTGAYAHPSKSGHDIHDRNIVYTSTDTDQVPDQAWAQPAHHSAHTSVVSHKPGYPPQDAFMTPSSTQSTASPLAAAAGAAVAAVGPQAHPPHSHSSFMDKVRSAKFLTPWMGSGGSRHDLAAGTAAAPAADLGGHNPHPQPQYPVQQHQVHPAGAQNNQYPLQTNQQRYAPQVGSNVTPWNGNTGGHSQANWLLPQS